MKKTLIAAALLVASSIVFAQAYIGAMAGRSHASIGCAGTLYCNNNSTGFKVQAGYQFAPRFATELVYFNLGSVDTYLTGVGAANIKGTGVGLHALGFLPFAQGLSGFARIGMNRTAAEADMPGAGSRTRRATNASFGMGVDYAILHNMLLRGEVERYRLDVLDDRYNVTNLAVGVNYRF